ncbi:MAG: hypothetical protein GQ547_07180 [Methylophaga sp.]|nr:hypothetical protein [Methylophaga sp.]
MADLKFNSLDEFREVPFSKLSLSVKHEKLLKRICSLNTSKLCCIAEDVGGLLDLEPYDFSQIPTVGKSYVSSLVLLKKELLNTELRDLIGGNDVNSLVSLENLTDNFSVIPHSLSDLHLNYQHLEAQDIKLITKLTKLYGQISIEGIISLDPNELKEEGIHFGKLYLTTLNKLKNSIKKEVSYIIENQYEFSSLEPRLFTSSQVEFYGVADIDEMLIEDVESYLWTLDDKKQDIALSRWGYNQDNETLEEVGERLDVTRERVRQLEAQIKVELPFHLRIYPKVLWENIRENMEGDLISTLPLLAQCFNTDKLFYSFIELCCQVKKGSLIEITLPKVRKRLLDSYFCSHQSPVAHTTIVEELTSEFGYSRALAQITIRKLIEVGSVQVTEAGIKPQNMGNREAVAHVLTFHPKGLPWKDVVKIANTNNYAKHINEERLTHGFNDSNYVYLCSHGHYRNLIFLDLELFDFKVTMQHLLDYFGFHNVKALNLHDYYQQTLNERQDIEYFTLRHIIRTYGEEFGLYFNGKSGVDNVSLNKVSERVTQKDVIVQVLNKSKGAMTKAELAERLRSKSLGHAGYYVDELMKTNKVIRIDKMMYSTPEKAFKDIDSGKILSLVKRLMQTTEKIVEADIFRQYVNRELNLSYSKYFYVALIAINLDELGWYRSNNLISNTLIEYKNLLHIYKTVCLESVSNSENLKKVQDVLWISNSVASNVLHQWQWQMKSE